MNETTLQSRHYTRWQASGIHLLISAGIAAIALYVLLRVWYPPPFFTGEGGNDLLFILIAVDVVLGPLITLIIFKSGKPSLRFDLTVIGLVQVSALVYGLHVMFLARPVYVVLALDQFETVRANDLEDADIAQAPNPLFRSLPLSGPVVVAVDLPKDMQKLKDIIGETQQSGKTVTVLPKYYVPYAQQAQQAAAQGQPLAPAIKRGGVFATLAQAWLEKAGRKADGLSFIPLQMRRGMGAVLIDSKRGGIVTMLPPTP